MYRKIYIVVIFLLISMMTACRSDTNHINLSTKSEDEVSTAVICESAANVFIYVHGQVNHPGVYQVNSGDRLFSVIEKAGGFTKKAAKDVLNLAEPVTDGQAVYVMSKKEYRKAHRNNNHNESSTESDGRLPPQDAQGIVNINTATEKELMTLSGIGQSKALAIIEYREKNGNFTNPEELKNVSGIGDATFSKIKDRITVG